MNPSHFPLTTRLPGIRNLVDLKGHTTFETYCLEISKDCCPYLQPAAKTGVLYATQYVVSDEVKTISELHAEIFYVCVLHTEYLRNFRKTDPAAGSIACENVIFTFPNTFDSVSGPELFDWPHWVLKCFYSKVGVMFGKFWRGEEDISRAGLSIPPPPCHFISIRSAIKQRDPYFLNQQPHILAQLINALDDGFNVHTAIGKQSIEVVSLENMRKVAYYEQALTWSASQLPAAQEL